ncbi:MAG: FMN-binding protein, partial [Oscillibacter sp.]|nr:FMN-binding protein [Oscillibacter sp.]
MKDKTKTKAILCAIGAVAIIAALAASEKNWVVPAKEDAAVTETSGTSEIAGALTGTADGFGGPVTVALSMDGDTIAAVDITGDNETPEVGGAAIPTLAEQVLAAQGPDIDGVSGATFTSTAVKEAVTSALAQAGTSGGGAAGDYTASADGFGGPVTVALTMDGDTIAAVDITGDNETPEVGGAAIPTLAEQVLAAQGPDIDGVSGATFTSTAVKEAVAAALASGSGAGGAEGPKAADGNKFIPGTYSGSSKGFGGDVEVTVTVSENAIESIEIAGDHETENIGSFAVEMLGDRIMDAQ